jgi:preprotein translocase subunit SecE
MKSTLTRVAAVIVVTALAVLLVPGIDDAVELGFQIVVLIASS